MPFDLLIFFTPSVPTSSGVTITTWPSLALLLLKLAAHEVVEELIAAAHLDVGVDHDAVPALEQRVEDLVQADVDAAGVALGEVLAREHLRHRLARAASRMMSTRLILPSHSPL